MPGLDISDDVADAQIEQLLARATARLQQKEKDGLKDRQLQAVDLNFPKLDAGDLQKPYVTVKGDIASVDSSRLLQEKQRRLANQARKIEDPVTTKKAAEEVSISSFEKPSTPSQ